MTTPRQIFISRFSAIVALFATAVWSCGSQESSKFGEDTPNSSDTDSGSGSGSVGSLGSSTNDDAPASCNTPEATRVCCRIGTQTCSGTGEFHTWGPCLDAAGHTVTCGPEIDVDSGASDRDRDGGGAGTGGGGAEDAGRGSGGGGHEDAGQGSGDGGGGTEMQPPPCSSPVNLEPDIIAAYFPAKNESVGRGGQIKVWINDELPMMIAPNEVVDPTSGAIKTPGDRTAKASDGYLYEPMLYINGKAYFPTAIKGWYNNKSPVYGYIGQQVVGEQVQGMDPLPAGTQTDDMYTGEDIWEVNALGLAPGSYDAEFVIKDGDAERGLGCVRIVIN